MERPNDGGAIRLTNKTAIALRRSARQERTMALCAGVVLTVALAVIAVLLGIRWLPAVPIVTAIAVMLDAAIAVSARSRYLSLTAQAICAEAAARQLRADRKEKDRRAQAQRDFDGVKADVLASAAEAQRESESASAQDEAPLEQERDEETSGDGEMRASDAQAETDAPAPHRRRRQASLTVLRPEDVSFGGDPRVDDAK